MDEGMVSGESVAIDRLTTELAEAQRKIADLRRVNHALYTKLAGIEEIIHTGHLAPLLAPCGQVEVLPDELKRVDEILAHHVRGEGR